MKLKRLNIEDCFEDVFIPINTIATLKRLNEILDNNNTNFAGGLNKDELLKFRKCLWILNAQFYGDISIIDMMKEWSDISGKNNRGG